MNITTTQTEPSIVNFKPVFEADPPDYLRLKDNPKAAFYACAITHKRSMLRGQKLREIDELGTGQVPLKADQYRHVLLNYAQTVSQVYSETVGYCEVKTRPSKSSPARTEVHLKVKQPPHSANGCDEQESDKKWVSVFSNRVVEFGGAHFVNRWTLFDQLKRDHVYKNEHASRRHKKDWVWEIDQPSVWPWRQEIEALLLAQLPDDLESQCAAITVQRAQKQVIKLAEAAARAVLEEERKAAEPARLAAAKAVADESRRVEAKKLAARVAKLRKMPGWINATVEYVEYYGTSRDQKKRRIKVKGVEVRKKPYGNSFQAVLIECEDVTLKKPWDTTTIWLADGTQVHPELTD